MEQNQEIEMLKRRPHYEALYMGELAVKLTGPVTTAERLEYLDWPPEQGLID